MNSGCLLHLPACFLARMSSRGHCMPDLLRPPTRMMDGLLLQCCIMHAQCLYVEWDNSIACSRPWSDVLAILHVHRCHLPFTHQKKDEPLELNFHRKRARADESKKRNGQKPIELCEVRTQVLELHKSGPPTPIPSDA